MKTWSAPSVGSNLPIPARVYLCSSTIKGNPFLLLYHLLIQHSYGTNSHIYTIYSDLIRRNERQKWLKSWTLDQNHSTTARDRVKRWAPRPANTIMSSLIWLKAPISILVPISWLPGVAYNNIYCIYNVYIYVHIHTYKYIQVCIQVYIQVYIQVHTQVCIQVYIQVCTQVYKHVCYRCVYTYIIKYIYQSICMIYTSTYTYIHIYICIYIYIYILTSVKTSMYTCIYIYTQIYT